MECSQLSDLSSFETNGADDLMARSQQELYDRVAYLEKRVREQEDEIVCLKGAMADVLRRVSLVETTKAQNSILPSKPLMRTPRKSPMGLERPKSSGNPLENVNVLHRSATPPSSRQSPRGASASSIKKWSSMSNSIETNGHQSPRQSHSGQLTQANKDTRWDEEGYLTMYLKGRKVTMHAPTWVKCVEINKDNKPPKAKLKLDWAYGYRGRDCRSNLYQLPTGEIVFFTAAVAVLYNVEEQSQRFYLEHTDDIKCLAVHPDMITIATGQVAGHEKKSGSPHVRVWDSVSLNTLYVIGMKDKSFQRAVCCVAFSHSKDGDSDMLCCVDDANEHILSIWKLTGKGKKIAETKSSNEPVTACEFHPQLPNSLITCGKNQICFWTFENGSLSKKSGIFEKNDKPKYIICMTFTYDGDLATGDSNGNIYIWKKGGQQITGAITGAHEGPIFSICAVNDEDHTYLSAGGKDRRVVQYDSSFSPTGKEAEVPEVYGAVRMVGKARGGSILVGTVRNCILQGSFDELKCILDGHKEELWGLATHPSQLQFMTCGSDRFVYMWNTQTHSAVWCKEINDPAHCCCFHPNGEVAAIGLTTGKWLVLDVDTQEIIYISKDGREQHECIQYSPDGEKLAVACRDNYIYLYTVSDEGKKYSRIGRCQGHSSYVTNVDWSVDGTMLMSNSGDYEILYWDASDAKQITSKDETRDIEFATQNCTLSINVAGMWPEEADGTDINNCAKSHNNKVLVNADDNGLVNVFDYPCMEPKSVGQQCRGHSSHVTRVAFTCDDQRVLSTGGRDMAILQWEVQQ